MEKLILTVDGMKCGGCESSVVASLEAAEGVDSATAQHQSGTVEISFDGVKIAPESLADIISGCGYKVREQKE